MAGLRAKIVQYFYGVVLWFHECLPSVRRRIAEEQRLHEMRKDLHTVKIVRCEFEVLLKYPGYAGQYAPPPEMATWLWENITAKNRVWYNERTSFPHSFTIFWFESETDAMLFKLRFG